MTTTELSLLTLLAAEMFFIGVWRLIQAGPEPITPEPVAAYKYAAPYRQPGAPLGKRPPSMESFKAEIALTPDGFGRARHRAPEPVEGEIVTTPPPGYMAAPPVNLRTHKAHEDWPWDTAEIEMRWEAHFADQPDDQAIVKDWAGAGR